MDAQDILNSLVEARNAVVIVRVKTQFDFPLADAKLVRISNYLGAQVKAAEIEVWREAGLLEANHA